MGFSAKVFWGQGTSQLKFDHFGGKFAKSTPKSTTLGFSKVLLDRPLCEKKKHCSGGKPRLFRHFHKSEDKILADPTLKVDIRSG